jgi:hypothetical protein
MKLKDILNEADGDTPEGDVPETTVQSPEDAAVNKAEDDLINSLGSEDTASAPTTNDVATETTPNAENSPAVDDATAAANTVMSDDNKSKKAQNPVASKPYSERIKTMISLMKEFGYYDLDYQIQDGNKSVITVAGTLTDQHISDLKKFSGEIKVNSAITSSKVDTDKFVTTITLSNKASLQTFRDLIASGEEETSSSPTEGSTEGGEMGSPEEVPPEGGEGGGEIAGTEETPPEGAAPEAETAAPEGTEATPAPGPEAAPAV